LQHLLILVSNFNFYALVAAKRFKRIQDGVSLKAKNNAQHHNTGTVPIV
jgi:hypothetical protein